MHEMFRRWASAISEAVGSSRAFIVALLIVITWACTGPMFNYSDTWQLVINTGTTIVTFLMVFLIQNAQNRDARALHIKLDEIIRSMEGARNSLVNLDNASDEEMDRLKKEFERLSETVDETSLTAVIPHEVLAEEIEELQEKVDDLQEEIEEHDSKTYESPQAVHRVISGL